MKYNQGFILFLTIFLIGIILTGFSTEGFSQCEPDLVNCIDVDEPGQMCPSVLPDAMVGDFYDQNITVLTPESGNVGELNITIVKLRLESIENLPEGMSYHSENTEFYANEAYCIKLDGTPILAGTYKLKITVSPYISILGIPVKWGEHVDSTSVVVNVGIPAYIDPVENQDFTMINAFPNPFTWEAKIGFYDQKTEDVELRVFNLTGQQVHYERIDQAVGLNYFDFNGNSLSPGYYIYAVIRKDEVLNGKLIKN